MCVHGDPFYEPPKRFREKLEYGDQEELEDEDKRYDEKEEK